MNSINAQEQNRMALHPMQSWEWGEARKKMGIQVETLVDSDTLFQFTIHPIPHTPFSVGYLPRSEMPSVSVLEKLYDYGKKNKVLFIKMEPYIPYEENFKFQISNFKLTKSSHPLFPEWTQTLDLTQTDDILLNHMKSKTRYNIRLAEKKGVVVKDMSTDEGYEIFEKLYFETCKRQNYRGHMPTYHKTLWNTLKGTQAHILIAFIGNTPLAAYELLYFKKNIYYLYGGSSSLHKNVMAANLLMWEAIKLGKKLGASTFDMWGSLSPDYDGNHAWAGFTRFKEGYGTKFVHLSPSFDLVIHPYLYMVYNVLHELREKTL